MNQITNCSNLYFVTKAFIVRPKYGMGASSVLSQLSIARVARLAFVGLVCREFSPVRALA